MNGSAKVSSALRGLSGGVEPKGLATFLPKEAVSPRPRGPRVERGAGVGVRPR